MKPDELLENAELFFFPAYTQPDTTLHEVARARFRAVVGNAFDDARQQGRAERDAEVAALTERVRLAEIVCTIFGWTGSSAGPDESDRDKAVLQAWMDWHHLYSDPKAPTSKEWDDRIAELAARRDQIRQATLARIRGEADE